MISPIKLIDSLENNEEIPNISEAKIDVNAFSESPQRYTSKKSSPKKANSPKFIGNNSFDGISPSKLKNKLLDWSISNSGSPTKRKIADILALESEIQRSSSDKAYIDYLKNLILNLDSRIKV